jgi:hypothetical protein
MEVSPLGFPVKGRFRYQNRVFFKLPFSLAPTVSDGQSSFEVVYYLKVYPYTHTPAQGTLDLLLLLLLLLKRNIPVLILLLLLQVRAGVVRKNGPFVVLGPLKLEQRRI